MKATYSFRCLIASLTLGLLWALAGCGGEGSEHASTFATSQTRMEKVAKAMLAYAADYDGTLPGKDWVDALEPYTKDPDAFRSPAVGGEGYGFAFNSALIGKKLEEIADRSTTVMLFDSTEIRRNTVSDLSTLPNPARYGNENTIAYADGTVKKEASKDAYTVSSGRLRKLGAALLIYTSDYDERMPLEGRWMDGLKPYVPEAEAFHDPTLSPDKFGFALNKRAAGKLTTELGPLATAISLFSSTVTDRNATADLDTLPATGRYAGKNAILYMDGHVSSEIEKAVEKPVDNSKMEKLIPPAPKDEKHPATSASLF